MTLDRWRGQSGAVGWLVQRWDVYQVQRWMLHVGVEREPKTMRARIKAALLDLRELWNEMLWAERLLFLTVVLLGGVGVSWVVGSGVLTGLLAASAITLLAASVVMLVVNK